MRAWTLAVVIGAGATASANTGHHDVGGGGGGEAQCIRWEPIPSDLGARDLGADLDGGARDLGADLDGGARDLGTRDLGTLDPHAGQRCVERASLFSCDVSGRGGGAGGIVFAGAIVAAMLLRRRDTRA